MKHIALIFALIAGLIHPAAAGGLKSMMVAPTNPYAFDTGVFVCTGVEARMYFENTTGAPIYIRSITSFLGMTGGAVADFFVRIWRESDHTVIQFTNWDHYKDPTALHNLVDNFAPDYVEIPAGDKVTLSYNCTKFGATAASGRVITRIMFLDTAP